MFHRHGRIIRSQSRRSSTVKHLRKAKQVANLLTTTILDEMCGNGWDLITF